MNKHIFLNFYSTLQRYKSLLSLLIWIALAFGLSKDWANSIWESKLLSWYWPSKTVVLALMLVLVFLYSAYLYLIKLEKEIEELKFKLSIKNLSPEEQADIAKQNISNSFRFIARLFGESNKTP